MKTESTKFQQIQRLALRWLLRLAPAVVFIAMIARAHVVPPEQFHPVVESYRRMMFLLNLNPVLWDEVKPDADRIATALETVSKERAESYRRHIADTIARATAPVKEGEAPPGPEVRKQAARTIFEFSTRAIAGLLTAELEQLKNSAANREQASARLDVARKLWAAFEHEVKATDQPRFREIGLCWLQLSTALGSAPLLGQGESPIDNAAIRREADEILGYVKLCYADYRAPAAGLLAPAPLASKTFNPRAAIPPKLPPGSNINKQRPRPRQILNLVARGVDETDTPLVALGDMTFDSPLIFGEPARSLGLSCNNCHNKSITNPQFVIPGLSRYPGGMDVSGTFFAPHANNGLFDPLDIPDLRGIRFTAPYGRNGRFASLRDFIRNVIVNEFNGPEPDPILVDAMLAYMMEFDFLPNPLLKQNGALDEKASPAARRGEQVFKQPFPQMGGMSCATCHEPSASFVDHKRHDIGSVDGAEESSLDRALDTPTLLSSRFTAPYFHDGSLATLKDVVSWFDKRFGLKLDAGQTSDLTAYLEAVGDGAEPYEEDPDLASPGEVQEQYFFMASWEFLRSKSKPALADLLFRTVAQELRNEKWGLKYPEAAETVEKLAQLADAAIAANQAGQTDVVDARVAEFRKLYEQNKALIDGDAAPATKPTAQTTPSAPSRPADYAAGRP